MTFTIMIVDNDSVNSFVLKNIITRNYSDAEVLMFPDGYAALEFLAEINLAGDTFPEVILLDLFMPVMSGFEFLDKYEELYTHKTTAVFAMSNSLDKGDQQRANNHIVVKGYITKPLIYNNIQFIIDTYVVSPSNEEFKA